MSEQLQDPCSAQDADDHIVYLFVEHIPGAHHDFFMRYKDDQLSDATLAAVRAYAEWMLALEKVTFSSVGSPTFDESGNITIGPVIDTFPLLTSYPFFSGPHTTARERYIKHFERRMQLINEDKWCMPSAKLESYLEMLEAKTLVEQCGDNGLDEGPFYLKHGEPKGDHILYTENGEVSGVIDWEW